MLVGMHKFAQILTGALSRKENEMRKVFMLLLVTVAVMTALPVNAQTASSAIIAGTVYDPNGAVVAGATVTAKNVETGIERTTQTSTGGVYRFDNLAPALYDIRIEGQGFAPAELKGVKVQVGEQRDVPVHLVIGTTTGTVNVTAQLPLVEGSKTDVSTVVTDTAVATLPTTTAFNGLGGVSNDYAALATTAPGVR